jgi:hypothetical protein
MVFRSLPMVIHSTARLSRASILARSRSTATPTMVFAREISPSVLDICPTALALALLG